MSGQPDFDLTREGRVVFIRCIGTWDTHHALAFRGALDEFVSPLRDGRPWATLVDFSGWAPAAPEVTAMANKTRDLVDEAGRTHGAYLFGSLAVAEALIEKGVIDPASTRVQYFQSEELAREWLAELGHLPRES